MATLADAVGAPVTIEAGGRSWELHPLRLRDWGRLERWMRDEVIRAATEVLKDADLDEARMGIVMREAHRQAAAMSIQSADAMQGLLSSLGGMLKIIYLSLRHGEPNLTEAEFDDRLGYDIRTLATLAERVFEISFPEQAGESAKDRPGAGESPRQ